MSEPSKLGRRGFLGVGVAAVAAATVTPALRPQRRGEARFSVTDGFPDRPVTVEVHVPSAPDGAVVSGVLDIETPTERLTVPLDAATFAGGRAVVEAVLRYPYDRRVPGEYRYVARLEADGVAVATLEAAAYRVRRVVYFS